MSRPKGRGWSRTLHLGEKLAIPAEACAYRFGILAQTGAGKSNAAVVFAEEMHRAGYPFVAIDPKGDWWGIRSAVDGRGAGLAIPILGGLHGDCPLEANGGAAVADLVHDENLTCLLDVSDFSKGERAQFLVAFAERLFQRHRRAPAARHLIFEEAHEYLPQAVVKTDQTPRLKEAVARLVLQGRSFGLGCTLISQRSARLHKDVLTQVDTLIVMRTSSPQDRAAVGAWVDEHLEGRELMATLPKLRSGEAWVWSPHVLDVCERFTFRRRATFDSGATPTLGKARRSPALADIDLKALRATMAAAIERRDAQDPRALQKRIRELQSALAAAENVNAAKAAEARRDAHLKASDLRRLEALVRRAERLGDRAREAYEEACSALRRAGSPPTVVAIEKPRAVGPSTVQAPAAHARVDWAPESAPPAAPSFPTGTTAERILGALLQLEQLGVTTPPKVQVAMLAGYSNPRSKGFTNAVGALHSEGLVQYPSAGRVAITAPGRARAGEVEPLRSAAELQERVIQLVGGVAGKVLRPLVQAYPEEMDLEQLAAGAGYTNPRSKGFTNTVGRLSGLGFVERSPGRARASELLFP